MPNSIKTCSFFLFVLFLVGFLNQVNAQQNKSTYVENLLSERLQKDKDLIDTAVSRFNEEERNHFAEKGLQYFEPDIAYKVDAIFTLDTSTAVFQMPTTTDRKPNYRIYGHLDFVVNDTACKLTVYQNYDYRNHPGYDNSLFIPFKDNTNEFTTYGGGRYIDIPIPEKDKFKLDFNMAYNPYCAYADRWSCPLVPFVNHLNVSVFAGEKNYK